jgi:threonine synthase
MGVSGTRRLTLGEGSTPLVAAPRLSVRLGVQLHLKCEGLNPTGSFKDRGMVVAVERALESGAHTVVCASTGNTAASAAAYAARAGLRAVVLTPQGATASAKRAQARAAGACLVELAGTFDDALRCCRELAQEEGFVLVNSLNADRLEGQKSVVAELIEELGGAPDVIALPFGGGGNSRAVAQGVAEANVSVRLLAGEAAERSTTWASAIRIGDPAHAAKIAALRAADRLEVVTLSEDELRSAWVELAEVEGVFCEPASAAGFAAVRRAGVEAGSVVVCILTGHGLKDTASVAESDVHAVEPTVAAILAALP